MEEMKLLWFSTIGVIILFMAALGILINKKVFGILIDSRCKMSLSRLQLVLWTILIVSCIFALSIYYQSMDITIDERIWALLGVSIGSTAGAIMIKGVKQVNQPSDKLVASLSSETSNEGLLHVTNSVNKAKFSDMFKGDEISDYNYIDISKVQMFFFTVAAWFGYVGVIWSHTFKVVKEITNAANETITQTVYVFPELSTGIITLIGISHVGYLTVKATDKTPKQQ